MTAGTTSTTAGGAFTTVLNAAVGSAATSLDRQVTRWTDRLNGIASDPVASGALRAGVRGENPVWGAIKGAWQDGSSAVRAAVVTAVVAMIVLLLVSPVLLLAFLLSLLVIAAVHRARAATR
jgi:hypothetical protein